MLNMRLSFFGRNAVSAIKISSRTAAAIDAVVVNSAANTQDTTTYCCQRAEVPAIIPTHPDARDVWICRTSIIVSVIVVYNS